MNKLGTNFAVFILFFGVATVQAFQTQNWLLVSFWVAIGLVFLWADLKNSSSDPK
jgi:type IV secretory pathway TrbD component